MVLPWPAPHPQPRSRLAPQAPAWPPSLPWPGDSDPAFYLPTARGGAGGGGEHLTPAAAKMAHLSPGASSPVLCPLPQPLQHIKPPAPDLPKQVVRAGVNSQAQGLVVASVSRWLAGVHCPPGLSQPLPPLATCFLVPSTLPGAGLRLEGATRLYF